MIDPQAETKRSGDVVTARIDELNRQAWEIHITQPEKGLELSEQAKALSERNKYHKGLAYAIRNLGVCHRYLSNLETALSLSIEALEMFKNQNDQSGESQALVSIGAIYYYMGDYERGLDYFLQGLKIGEEIGNKEALANGYNGAGYIYSLLNNHEKGLDFLRKALALSREIKNYNIESSSLDSLAFVYKNNNQIEKAFEAYSECLRISEEKNDQRNLGYALHGIGDLLVIQNKPEEAKEYYHKSLEIHKWIGYKVGIADTLLQLGKLFLNNKNLGEAKGYLQEALDVGESIKAKAIIYEVHEALSNLYQSKKDFELFVHHYKLFHKYKSEVFREEQESKQKYLTLQYELQFSQLTNVVMKEKNEELKKKTEELERSYNSVSVLSNIGQDITSTLSLDTILNTVYENVNELMDATVFGIGIFNREKNCIEYRMSIEKGVRYQPYHRSMKDKNQFPVWCIENAKEVFINDIHREYSKYLPNIDMTILNNAAMEDGSLPENPHSLIYLPLLVKDEVIGLLSVQSYQMNAYTPHHLNMLKTLASYTAAALYNAQSFEALENTLHELKVTQAQLIQQEKMASLGELTAGIAHEIQNPLNFVNNFSEVNTELIEEVHEEIRQGNYEEVKALTMDILENERKIIYHGKRADSIVKSMLQHSRAGTGEIQETDINGLADEYLRLAYHGMRAKDKTFNVSLKTEFDPDLKKLNIIPRDIGRVILNLITNAFYAVTDASARSTGPASASSATTLYQPTVTISTGQEGGKAKIQVKDNGNGIPKKMLDKIFQPFFTTKPTGSGTGLGLSLSYDIVKAHGGEMRVESEEGEYAEFTILLPIN